MNCPFAQKGCGGCRGTDKMYGDTLKEKEARVRAFFPQCEKILGCETPLHSRNKLLRTFANGKQSLYSGIYRAGTHQVISVDRCSLEDERLQSTAESITEILKNAGFSAYREDFHRGTLRHMILRIAPRTGQMLATLITGTETLENGEAIAREIIFKNPAVKGVIHNYNPRESSAVLGFKDRLLYGRDEIWDELCGLDVCLNSRSFYQVNAAQAEKLYDTAIRMASLTKEDHVLDAYCGVGVIGMCAAVKCGSVTGVEIVKPAVACAEKAARRNGLDNISFIAGDVLKALRDKEKHFDCVFCDPPRAGLSEAFLRALAEHAPERIVYISCFPETLARDTGLLSEYGYAVNAVRPVDMFPYTEHVENVILLSQQKPDATIRVGIDLKPEDVTAAESKATYADLKAYIEEKYGFKVSNLYIAQAKAAMGIKERENYNLPKNENSRQPVCPPPKMKAIQEALRHFKMI